MNSYLRIAEAVLLTARQPLSAQEILNRAYVEGLVPPQLHGKTQQKTLGARLSEDILTHRERSAFFRTRPGRFFLRCLMNDSSLPEEFRTPIVARRRQRDLRRGRLLSFNRSHLSQTEDTSRVGELISDLLGKQKFHYVKDLRSRGPEDVIVWSFVIVTRGVNVLAYRHGHYREDRDTFLNRRSIGFYTPVVDCDYDLFDDGSRGIMSSGMKAVLMDLDFPISGLREEDQENVGLTGFLLPQQLEDVCDILAVVRFECPAWFEPLNRRLAINDLTWMDMSRPVNHPDDFDPWSRRVLEWAHNAEM